MAVDDATRRVIRGRWGGERGRRREGVGDREGEREDGWRTKQRLRIPTEKEITKEDTCELKEPGTDEGGGGWRGQP